MNRCIAYLRKSTEDKKGLSIPAQRSVALELAQKQGFELVKTYSEEHSALHTGRLEFTKLMDDIRAGKAEYILCWQLNRLARNMDDGGAIIHALQNKIIKGIITANKTYLPDHAVYEMLLEFGVANQSSRDLSNNVKRGNKEKIKQGGWPGKAPVGYLNNIGQYSVEIDPIRGSLIRMRILAIMNHTNHDRMYNVDSHRECYVLVDCSGRILDAHSYYKDLLHLEWQNVNYDHIPLDQSLWIGQNAPALVYEGENLSITAIPFGFVFLLHLKDTRLNESRIERLNKEQLEIIILLDNGLKYEEIDRALCLKANQAKSKICDIHRKLDTKLNTGKELANYAPLASRALNAKLK